MVMNIDGKEDTESQMDGLTNRGTNRQTDGRGQTDKWTDTDR
jgi:hypothetical protein